MNYAGTKDRKRDLEMLGSQASNNPPPSFTNFKLYDYNRIRHYSSIYYTILGQTFGVSDTL